MRKNPNARLGSKSKKTDAIRRHKFFRSIDWVALERREISPPIVPIVVSIGLLLFKGVANWFFLKYIKTDPESAEVRPNICFLDNVLTNVVIYRILIHCSPQKLWLGHLATMIYCKLLNPTVIS